MGKTTAEHDDGYTKLVFFISLHQTVFENVRQFFIQLHVLTCTRLGNIQTQREWITALLKRYYGVVAVSQKYQNFKRSETATLSQLSADMYNYIFFIYKHTRKHIVCLFGGFESHSSIFHICGDVTITGAGMQILTFTRL